MFNKLFRIRKTEVNVIEDSPKKYQCNLCKAEDDHQEVVLKFYEEQFSVCIPCVIKFLNTQKEIGQMLPIDQ